MRHLEISPLDGRYAARLGALSEIFSEFALMRARCDVELRYVLALEETGIFPPLAESERCAIEQALDGFDEAAFARIKEIEETTRHDVKSCEIYLRERLGLAHPNRIHFGLTSEDVNNLALGQLLRAYRDDHQVPLLRRLVAQLADQAERWRATVFPGRTHGQPASPTTLGKEWAVFVSRLLRQGRQLERLVFTGKLNGATGTYAASCAALPGFDWPAFAGRFVSSLGLEPNPCTTQIEGYDAIAEYLGIVSRINGIVLDLDLDCWAYISRGDLIQRSRAGEVGSSTMPHKVNPIRFENSEGNLTVSTGLIHTLTEKLARSRMQRDLSDMTVRRNIGVALAHAHLAIDQTIGGLAELDADAGALRARVNEAPEVLAEAYQTILRAAGVEDPYEMLKAATRGKLVTLDGLREWIDRLPVGEDVKAEMKRLSPADYVGRAEGLCDLVVAEARVWLSEAARSS